jgi:hypothetical protein
LAACLPLAASLVCSPRQVSGRRVSASYHGGRQLPILTRAIHLPSWQCTCTADCPLTPCHLQAATAMCLLHRYVDRHMSSVCRSAPVQPLPAGAIRLPSLRCALSDNSAVILYHLLTALPVWSYCPNYSHWVTSVRHTPGVATPPSFLSPFVIRSLRWPSASDSGVCHPLSVLVVCSPRPLCAQRVVSDRRARGLRIPLDMVVIAPR